MPAVWDVFNFNDELDLLELRLELLADVVDHFVVVEAPETFTGLPKPLHFTENRDRFARWSSQLRTVPVAFSPTEEPWEREHEQRRTSRDFILSTVAPDDVVIYGDVDELPNPHSIDGLRHTLDVPMRLEMVNANYYANWTFRLPFDNGPIAFRKEMAQVPEVATVLGDISFYGSGEAITRLPDSGWHLSFSGGSAAVRSKLSSYSHQEYNPSAEGGSWEHANRCLEYGINPSGCDVMTWIPVESMGSTIGSVAQKWPQFFHPEPFAATTYRRRSYAGYTYVRSRIPRWLRDLIDDRFAAAFPLLAPGFLAADFTRRLVARLRRDRQQRRR